MKLPDSCSATRDLGAQPNWPKAWSHEMQDPYTGRYAPSPTCKLIFQCLPEFAPQPRIIAEYLRIRPLLTAALERQR
jgi:hypothetical protein